MYPPNVLPDCQRYYRWWWRQSEELWAVHAMDDYPEMEELTSGLDYKFLSCECVTIDYRKSLHGTYGITRPLETGEEFLIAVSFHGEPHESEFNAIGEHAVSHRAHCERRLDYAIGNQTKDRSEHHPLRSFALPPVI